MWGSQSPTVGAESPKEKRKDVFGWAASTVSHHHDSEKMELDNKGSNGSQVLIDLMDHNQPARMLSWWRACNLEAYNVIVNRQLRNLFFQEVQGNLNVNPTQLAVVGFFAQNNNNTANAADDDM